MYHQLLAKGIDKAAGAACYGDLDGVELFNGHRVTQAVAPQPVGGCDDEFIGATGLNLPDGIDLGGLAVTVLDRQELIEYSNIEQQQHCFARPVTLYGKETLAGIVGVQEVHLGHVTELFILLPVRLKRDATMEEYLQVGPHLVDAGFARALQHLAQHRQEPRRHATQVGHVGTNAGLDQLRQFLGPILHKGHLFAGDARQIGQWIHVLDEVGTQVPYPNARFQLQVVGKAAPQDECFSREDAAGGIQVQVVRNHIACPNIMIPTERFAGDGDILAATVTRTRRLGKIHATPRPQLVLDAIDHAHDLRPQVLVGVQGQCRSKLPISPDGREVIFTSYARQGGFLDQAHQLALLHGIGMVDEAGMLLHARQEMTADKWCEIYHCCKSSNKPRNHVNRTWKNQENHALCR